MARVRSKARILETSITAGNGPYALRGAVDGSYNTFASIMAIGDTTFVTVVEPGVAFWTGTATYSAANEITLTTIEERKGTFGANTKEIYTAYPASRAMFPEDISGAIVTGGTSTAYTVASYRVYDTLARLDANIIAFTPHVTNGQTVTLSLDGLTAKPLRPSPGVELQSNTLIQGTPYLALYNNTDGVFYLHMGGGSLGMPIGSTVIWHTDTLPSSALAWCNGAPLSRAAFPVLFSILGTTYGAPSGSTFNLPDMREVVPIGKAGMGGTSGRGLVAYTGDNTLNTVFGEQNHILSVGEMPSHAHGVTDPGHVHPIPQINNLGNQNFPAAGNNAAAPNAATASAFTGVSIQNTGGGGAHNNMQPCVTCNYITRVL